MCEKYNYNIIQNDSLKGKLKLNYLTVYAM